MHAEHRGLLLQDAARPQAEGRMRPPPLARVINYTVTLALVLMVVLLIAGTLDQIAYRSAFK
jgi:hypothetical protein